jgi:HEAT repeat protein
MRRRAADLLAEQAAKGTLGAEAAEAICRSVIVEKDALIWRSALAALAAQTSEPATRLVYAGLSHPAAEVRRRACEHLLKHPEARHAEVLMKSLEDAEPQVVRAALKALAASGGPVETPPLERLLAESDKSLRVEAAETLARLEAASGPAALERLALDDDPAIRRQAAAAMGRIGDEAFLPSLMRLLDDQGGVRQTALASLAQIAGADMARTGQTEPPSNSLEEVRRWRAWHQQRH